MGLNKVVVYKKARYRGRVRIRDVLPISLESAERPVELFLKVVVLLFVVKTRVFDVHTVFVQRIFGRKHLPIRLAVRGKAVVNERGRYDARLLQGLLSARLVRNSILGLKDTTLVAFLSIIKSCLVGF